jgi:flagellin-like protein
MKEKNLLQLNKKGVSELLGYVILIGIAVSLSVAVFFYLKLYLPDERPECDVDIKATIDSLKCTLNAPINPTRADVIIEVSNRGLFKIEGAYVKIGDVGRAFKKDLNPALFLTSTCSPSGILNPGDKFCKTFTITPAPTVKQEISVQPVIYIDNQPILCPQAITTKEIDCTP